MLIMLFIKVIIIMSTFYKLMWLSIVLSAISNKKLSKSNDKKDFCYVCLFFSTFSKKFLWLSTITMLWYLCVLFISVRVSANKQTNKPECQSSHCPDLSLLLLFWGEWRTIFNFTLRMTISVYIAISLLWKIWSFCLLSVFYCCYRNFSENIIIMYFRSTLYGNWS